MGGVTPGRSHILIDAREAFPCARSFCSRIVWHQMIRNPEDVPTTTLMLCPRSQLADATAPKASFGAETLAVHRVQPPGYPETRAGMAPHRVRGRRAPNAG